MNLITVFQRFPDHEACIEHLERVRWHHTPKCPLCESERVARKADGFRVGRWNCHSCKSSFNVLSGTIFEKTKIDLQKWFLAISIIINAKKGVSSCQLARDLDLNQKTAWYIGMRIRRAMATQGQLLSGIVEVDEAYLGGKPRKHNKRDHDAPGSPRGRGTDRLPVVGAVERGGNVVAEPSLRVDGFTLDRFISRYVDKDALLMTDEYPGYNRASKRMSHAVVAHRKQYVDGLIHTNTIESFWALVKRALFGQYHHYSVKHALAYVVEACFKYNIRKQTAGTFEGFLAGAVAA